ncbi:LytR C-terminal domain-containing protein [Streptomyces hiroshimensis]|uniref:Membrane protein n=1 Tax=Streptomyces hiroshimensis TaxID=66424 RepID=A0ABQ2YRS1_9ACTN|nr:LytR C-terminal domain-containing protein [Streptomyces hiroshimensis]GGX93193.1 membrane protein [Streptomyces hiroshimensis]
MSMLTPPGMGRKYRITGKRFPHMRRPRNRRRIVLAAVTSAVALAVAGWGTLQLVDVFTGGPSETQAHGAGAKGGKGAKDGDCKAAAEEGAEPKPLPRPSDITVNVYNATPRGGLAKITADELKSRGFKIGKVGNAPALYDKKVEKIGLLIGAPTAAEGALKVIGTQMAGAEVKNDQRTADEEVDLVIGNEYKELTARQDADRSLTDMGVEPGQAPSESPSPSSAPSPSKAASPAPRPSKC